MTLPTGVIWEQRPFPNSNFLLLDGAQPALIDSGFVAHAEETRRLALQQTKQVDWVFNTHWHSDHVGANRLLQGSGTGIIGSASDADDLEHAAAHCCMAEYLDQPVPEYRIDRTVTEGEDLVLGDGEWTVLAVPGHAPGHLALWSDEHRALAVGDTMSAYDVGWVNIMLEGPSAIDAAISSVTRLQEFDADIIFPGHGPLVDNPEPNLAKALQRLQKQRANLDIAVDYGAKRILAFALVIHGGMALTELDEYLVQQPWIQDSSAVMNASPSEFANGLIASMMKSGGLVQHDGVAYPAVDAAPADPSVFSLPFPRDWKQRLS